MKIKSVIPKVTFILFNAIMIYYFIRGFLHPVETNFWLVRYGFLIILMELFCAPAILAIHEIKKKKRIELFGFLLIIILFPLLFSFGYGNYKVFLFFVLTILSKFFLIKSENYEKDVKLSVSVMIAFMIGAFLSSIFLTKTVNIFAHQQELFASVNGVFINNPVQILIWGVLYYLLLTIFQMFDLWKIESVGILGSETRFPTNKHS